MVSCNSNMYSTTEVVERGKEHRLIHMNARLYDPTIGRFLSADTIIQAPYDTQSYNRYTYIRNNPLMYTDPSGHSWLSKAWKKVKKYVRVIVAVVVAAVITIYAPYLIPALSGGDFWATVGIGTIAGFASGAIMTGSLSGALKGAVFGAISAGVAFGVGEAFSSVGGLEHGANIFQNGKRGMQMARAIVHGISRGAIAKARGQTFRSGFWSGFASSALSPGTTLGGSGGGGFTLRTSIASIVGGTASKLGGGKFANGAVSGAFVHMFNAEGLASKFFAKQWTQQAGGKGAEEIAKSLNTNKAVENISKDAGVGVVGGAIAGTAIFGFPIGTIGGAIFGLAGGLVTGAAKESFGVNQYVDDRVTDVHDYVYNCVCGQPRGHK